MNMVSNVSTGGLVEFSEELQPSIVLESELEKGNKCIIYSFEGTICAIVFIDIPLGCGPSEDPLKEAYEN